MVNKYFKEANEIIQLFFATGTGPFTVFAPINEAFDAVNIPEEELLGKITYLQFSFKIYHTNFFINRKQFEICLCYKVMY